jgi:hypothetical protein
MLFTTTLRASRGGTGPTRSGYHIPVEPFKWPELSEVSGLGKQNTRQSPYPEGKLPTPASRRDRENAKPRPEGRSDVTTIVAGYLGLRESGR